MMHQAQPWSVLTSEFVAKRYLSLTIVNLTCKEHGTLRGTIAHNGNLEPCPRCHALRPIAVLGRELCRSMPGWRLIDPPLSSRDRTILNTQELEPAPRKPRPCRLRSSRSVSEADEADNESWP